MPDIFENIIFNGFAIQVRHCPKNHIIHTTFDGVISDYECNQAFEVIMNLCKNKNIYKWSFDLSNMHIHPYDLENIITHWFPRMHTHSQGKGLYTIVLPVDMDNRKAFINFFEQGICRKGCAYYFENVKEAYHWLAGQGEHQGYAPLVDSEMNNIKRNPISQK